MLQKQGRLKDGSVVTIRLLTADDQERLVAFFRELPEEQRLYLRHDVSNPEIVRSWTRNIDYDRVLPLVALSGDRIVGDATIHRVPHGWKRHLGTVRVVVAPDYHNKGLGTLLVHELVELATEIGLEKLWAELPLHAPAAIALFRKAGFSSKAVIEGLVKDLRGRDTDVVIMVCDLGTQHDI